MNEDNRKNLLEEIATYRIDKQCHYKSGNDCCHGANPVKSEGCIAICGEEASRQLIAKHPKLSSEEATTLIREAIEKES